MLDSLLLNKIKIYASYSDVLFILQNFFEYAVNIYNHFFKSRINVKILENSLE